MTNEQKDELIKYRIEKALQTIAEVEVLLQNNLWNTAINRLYYSCFYAVTALLLFHDIKAQTHSGVKQMFGQHFVLNNLISFEKGKFYSDLFEKRQRSDYEDFYEFNELEVRKLLIPAEELIKQIEILLFKNN